MFMWKTAFHRSSNHHSFTPTKTFLLLWITFWLHGKKYNICGVYGSWALYFWIVKLQFDVYSICWRGFILQDRIGMRSSMRQLWIQAWIHTRQRFVPIWSELSSKVYWFPPNNYFPYNVHSVAEQMKFLFFG